MGFCFGKIGKFPSWGCAINAKKLEIKFTHAVKESAAINPDNYNVVGVDITDAEIELQDDEKTVIIALKDGNEIANNTTFVVTVKEIASKADANVKTPIFTKTITFADTVNPTLVDVKYPQSGVAVINFSEELKVAGTVKVFADGKEDTAITSGLTEDGKGVKLTGLVANKEYKVVILGAKDYSNNLITPNPIEVTVKSEVVDKVNPTVTSLVSEGLTSFKVQFSEPLQVVDNVNAESKYFTVTAGVTVTNQVFDPKTNTVTVTIDPVNSGVKSIKISGYKDLAGNQGDAFTKNVVFTEVVPTVQKTEVVKDGTDTFVKLTFNTEIEKDAGADALATTVVTPENVVKNTTIPLNKYDVDADNKKVVKIDVTGMEAGQYEVTFKTTDINVTKDLKVSFEIAATGDTTIPKVDGEPTITNKTVTVVFDSEMGQSALDVNNYTVSGKKVFEKAVFKENNKTVELTLKADEVKYNGEYQLVISKNVKGKNNVALKEDYKYTGTFLENVAPTIAVAQFDGADQIVLTFSENIKTADELAGIEVFVDNVKVALGTIAQVDPAVEEIVLTKDGGGDFVEADKFESAVVVVKVLKDNNITDENGNALKGAITVEVKK